MVSEPDHFSFRSDFLEKYLTDLKNFSCFEIVVSSSFKFKSFVFWKKSNFRLWFIFSRLSANRILKNKVGNMIQHIGKPSSVRKFKKITRESKNGQVHWPSRGNAIYQLHGNGLTPFLEKKSFQQRKEPSLDAGQDLESLRESGLSAKA